MKGNQIDRSSHPQKFIYLLMILLLNNLLFPTQVTTIRSKIFNFNKFICNLDVEIFRQSNSILLCHYNGYDFINTDYQHIVTDDFGSLKNNEFMKLFAKGPT